MATLANLVVKVTGDSSSMERTMDRASRKMRSFSREAEKLLSSRLTQALSLGALTIGMNKAFQAADALDASNRRLSATAKITGQNLGFLQVTAQKANREFGLGSKLANDFAIEVTKLTSKAGEIEKTGEAIGALLNLGAARGFGAADTLQAVQQAILGIDEGTDKLFGKNPSVIYAEFARQVGLSVAKMSDGEKALAILNAAMVDGGKVADEYAKFLASPAGQAEQLRIKMEETAAAIGRSMNGVRVAVMPVLASMVDGIRKFIGWVQLMGVEVAVLQAKFRAWGRDDSIADAIAGESRTPAAGATGAIAHLERVQKEAARIRTEIAREMDLAMQITGPTNAIATLRDNFKSAADAAKELADQVDRLWTRHEQGRATASGSFTAGRVGRLGTDLAGGAGRMQRPAIPGMDLNFKGDPRKWLPAPPTPHQQPTGFLGGLRGGLSEMAGQVGGRVKALAAQFGPLAAVAAALKPVFEGLMEVLGPVLDTLGTPLRIVGNLIGSVIAPALKLLEFPLQALAVATSYVTQGFGWLLRSIGKAINFLLPGNPANGLVKMGQGMIDAAEAARRNLHATDDATEATREFAEALTNVPRVLRLAALRQGVGGGGPVNPNGPGAPPAGPTTPTNPNGPQTGPEFPGGPNGPTPGAPPSGPPSNPGTGGGGGQPNPVGGPDQSPLSRAGSVVFSGDIHLHGVQNLAQLLDELGREAERRMNRGGSFKLGLASL